MTKAQAKGKPAFRRFLESPIAGPLITLVAVATLLTIMVPNGTFLTMRSMSGIVNAATLSGIVTIGITLLMICDEFDLSVGALMAVSAFVYGAMTMHGSSPVLATLAALALTSLLGAVNGVLRVWTGIPSFVVTLGTQAVYRGALYVISGGIMLQTVSVQPVYNFFNGRLDWLAGAIPDANFRTSLFWLLGMVAVFQFLLVRTRFGNHIFSVGGNPGAAKAAGVDVKRTKVISFIISGFLGGLAGIMLFSQYKTAKIATASGEELNAIAAAVVGGTLLTGGSGSVIGALLGVLIISMLRTGVVLMGLPSDNFVAIVGVTIVIAAVFNYWIRRQA